MVPQYFFGDDTCSAGVNLCEACGPIEKHFFVFAAVVLPSLGVHMWQSQVENEH